MSTEVVITTEITNKQILLDSLKELNITSTQVKDDVFTWGQGYGKMTANISSGEISYDNMRLEQLNLIKRTYSKNLVLDTILKKGHHISSNNVLADGRIEIIASY